MSSSSRIGSVDRRNMVGRCIEGGNKKITEDGKRRPAYIVWGYEKLAVGGKPKGIEVCSCGITIVGVVSVYVWKKGTRRKSHQKIISNWLLRRHASCILRSRLENTVSPSRAT